MGDHACGDMRLHHFYGSAVGRDVRMYGSRVGRRQGHAGRDMHLHHFGGLVVIKGVVEWAGRRHMQRHALASHFALLQSLLLGLVVV